MRSPSLSSTFSRSKRLLSTASLDLKTQFRKLLRESAQPVAVVTSTTTPSSPSSSSNEQHSRYHGATLSSFTSIAMDPYPLVSFSLRLPSRMATYLGNTARNSSSWNDAERAQMVVNVLSAAQESLAVVFSRADLHPHPFSDSHIYRLNRHGLPVLNNSLGSISCQLVAPPIPLHDLELLKRGLDLKSMREKAGAEENVDGVTSELFIARVLDVEMDEQQMDSKDGRTPLLYYQRSYTTCSLDLTERK